MHTYVINILKLKYLQFSPTSFLAFFLLQQQQQQPQGDSLPPGWERHEDSEGAYFWHVKSGTIQRERPHHAQGKGQEMEEAAVR